jgi:hypothetical protein
MKMTFVNTHLDFNLDIFDLLSFAPAVAERLNIDEKC